MNTSSLRLLKFVFFASGFSSLVFQVSWQRILTLYYSVENISTTLIVTVYMLGLGLGAILGGHYIERVKNKLEFYVLIELLVGIFGFISIPFLEFLGKNTAGSSYVTSFIYMFSFLCFPTILMGSTLPLLTKIFNSKIDNFLHSLSTLYFINTLGAAVGTLVSSYILISFLGLDTSVYFAASINIFIAILIYIFRKSIYDEPATAILTDNTIKNSNEKLWSFNPIYAIVFTTGFVAIGYEIIWFRFIGTIVKASPYAFSSILFVYLLGIAFGSYYMDKYLAKNPSINKRNLFFIFQYLISFFVFISVTVYYFLISNINFFSKVNKISFINMKHPTIQMPSFDSAFDFFMGVYLMTDVFIYPFIFIFIPTLFMGGSFPLITSLAYNKNDNEGVVVGKVYFFNVLGNVVGGLVTGLLLLDILGTELSLILLSVVGVLFLFWVKSDKAIFQLKSKIALGVLTMLLFFTFFPRPTQLYTAIHYPAVKYHINKNKYITEGIDGVIFSYHNDDSLATYINGMGHGGRPNAEFYYEAIETFAHHRQIKKVLIIGFGTGSTAEAVLLLNPKPHIKIVELSETLIENLNNVAELKALLADENIHLEYCDGRKYLYNSSEKFDAILIDPLRSTTSFSNNLYSKQFFELIKNHLNPGGVFMAWMDEFHIIPKTLSTVFPYTKQYKYFNIASNKELELDTTFKYDFFKKFPKHYHELISKDSTLKHSINRTKILNTNTQYPINEDYKPRCEYFIGLSFID